MNKLISLLLLVVAPAFAAAPIDGVWKDSARDREIPYRIFAPENATGRCPVIIFSHGLGGTREGYGHLGRFWSSNGYVVIHIQHHGSDDAAWRGQKDRLQGMKAAAANLQNAIDRPRDVSVAIDHLADLDAAGGLKGRIDTNRIGVAGHSFGAFTVLAVAGQGFGPRARSLGDSRVSCGIAMSSPAPRGENSGGYDRIKIPLFHMTGTADTSVINDTKAEDRRIPFDGMKGVDRYLLTLAGGDHMVFAGRGPLGEDAKAQGAILTGSLAFWDAYLRGDEKAKKWLAGGDYAKQVGAAGVVELKVAEKP